MDDGPLQSALVHGFVGEAEELAERLTREVLELEKDSTRGNDRDARYDLLARGLHTLKGSAGSIGLRDLSQIAHRMEDVVVPARRARRPLPREIADTLLHALDLFLVRVRAHDEGAPLPPTTEMLERLDRLAKAPREPLGETTKDDRSPIRASPAGDDDLDGRSLRVEAEDIVGLMIEVERLRELRLRLDELERQLSRFGERAFDGTRGGEGESSLGAIRRGLRVDAAETAAIVESLEERVKGIVTQPIRLIVEPLRRTVRDQCRETGKEAELSIVGGEISLDRRVLGAIKEALVQLVRNAIDHGIEPPEERERRGKHQKGAVVIRVEQQGNLVFVEVADDGSGLDLEAIRKAAVASGILSEEIAGRLDPHAVHQLIFESGLSTRRTVTETSGRGLGMRIVKQQIEAIEGRVEVESRDSEGTRFVLTLPAPLGSTVVLLVRCGHEELGLPMLAVERVVSADKAKESALSYGEEVLPVIDLAAVLGLRRPHASFAGQSLLIVKAQAGRAALLVDEVTGDRDLAIRALPAELSTLRAFQGASTNARGQVVLILRPDWLVTQPASVARPTHAKRALVVDDSLTARALHRAMLEAGGFDVHVAASAEDGFRRLDGPPYDVIVCDIAMDPVNGFEFARRLRRLANERTRETPVILVSGRDAEGDEARALAAGADAFLGKAACAFGRLLEEVERQIARRRSAA